VAQARGFLTCCSRGRGSVCDFVIHAPEYTAIVLVLPSRRLHGTLAEMEAQAGEAVARLRLVPAGLCRSRELWACSQYGRLRFFRVLDNGLHELDRNGNPIPGVSALSGDAG
jgi:hypothetical protein